MAGTRGPVSYRVLQAWARAAVSIVYRRVDITGAANVPTDRPAILAANHGNALGDIAVLVAKVPKFPQFLAAASWWKSPPARLLFRLGGVVPIYRRRDGAETEQNTSTFEACHTALAAGAHIAIFPEGEMHTEPALLPLKTGTARIALGAATDANVRGVTIVPVGMVYADRGRFRSSVEIHFGEPIEIDEWIEPARADRAKAVRALTDLLADRLAQVTVNHGSPAEVALLDRAAEMSLADADADAASAEGAYARRNALRRSLASAVAMAGGESSAEYRELAAAVDAHTADLEQLGVAAPALPSLAEPAGNELERLQRELALLTPVAALGIVANGPVILGAYLSSTQVRQESWQATTKGVSGTFLCPVVWTLEFVVLSRRYGRVRALVLTGAGAISGLAALSWHDRLARRRGVSWLDRTSREQPSPLARARASRDAVRERVAALTGDR